MPAENYPGKRRPGSFNPFLGLLTVAILLSAITFSASWYAENVLMPRYCADIPETTRLLEEILTEERPAEAGSRIPYLIAAKLVYLLPKESAESTPAYLQRVQRYLQLRCSGAPKLAYEEM